MTKTVEAIYENGVLKPLEPLDLPNHQQVSITIDIPVKESPKESLRLWRQVYEGLSQQDIVEIEAIALDRSNFMQPEE